MLWKTCLKKEVVDFNKISTGFKQKNNKKNNSLLNIFKSTLRL